MELNRMKRYWLLLSAILCMGMPVLVTGTTQARYHNTVTTVAVLEAPVKNVTSNCLVSADDAARTVLLGEIGTNEMKTMPFWLQSADIDQTVSLNWGVADASHAEYLNMAVMVGSQVLEPGAEIELLKDARLDLQLVLWPTEAAYTTTHDELKITVHVTLGNSLWGTFQVTLPAVQIPVSEPTVSGNDADPTVSGNDANPTVSGNDAEPTVSDNDAADPDVSGNDANVGLPVVFSVSGNDAAALDEQIGLKTIPSFQAKGQLPVLLTLAEHISSVCLGVETMEGDVAVLNPLPDYTMFSVDGGAGYYMVYGDILPELVLHEITSVPMLMDFRYAKLEADTTLTLAAEAYMGKDLRKSCSAATKVTEVQDWQTMSLREPVQPVSVAAEEAAAEETDAVQSTGVAAEVTSENAGTTTETEAAKHGTETPVKKLLGPVLNFENILEFPFPMEWKEADLEYSVEHLTMTEEQILKYEPVKLSEDGLQATYYEEEENHRLELRLGQKFTQPGTYRIRMVWSYDGLCYDISTTTFFVNCAGRGEPITSDQEVPNDE